MPAASLIERPRNLGRTTWILAGLGAVALHAGGFAAALSSMQPDDPDEPGVPAIEIGVELAAPHIDPNDLPSGPDTQAAAMSPDIVEQKTVVEQSALPKALPTETSDPDRVVTTAERKKPKDDPKSPTVQMAPAAQSIAAEEMATPSVQTAVVSTHSVTSAIGSAESARRDRVTWQKELVAHLNRFKRYPADRVMLKAEVLVSFVLDRLGHVLSKRIVRGSGDPSFDSEVIKMLERSDPVPPPPPVVADEGLTFSLPVIFHAKDAAEAGGSNQSPK